METIRKIRCAYLRDGKSIRQITRDFHLSRNTVKKVLRGEATEFTYARTAQPLPKLGPYEDALLERLRADADQPKRCRRTAQVLFEELQRDGFPGGYDSVRRYVQKWRRRTESLPATVYIPQVFDPGDAYQFDWSHEWVELGGAVVKVKVAHFRLCHSRMMFCVAYLRESLEMLLDAHVRAFAFFGGSCQRGIYDNLKTVVTKILLGKDRTFNRRFQQLASHYLVEPVACTPAAGWEKGQVENQVQSMRRRLFTPRPQCADLAAFNAWLQDRCRMLAAGHRHPECPDRTVAEVFAEEQSRLLHVPLPFTGYKEVPARISTTALVAYDANRYSVPVTAVGRPALVRAGAERILVVQDGVVIADHPRHFGRHQVVYDPWHYLPVLAHKPGALRNGAPFRDWELPASLTAIREALGRYADGDRQFVGILGAVPLYGVDAVAAACAEALTLRAPSRDVVLTLLSRLHDTPTLPPEELPPHLPVLQTPPQANCHRYDVLLTGGCHVAG
ncbi:MAG: Integrase core domain protein [bacterium ADurb.Bin429]|nr:MAG: Integrase core domain protein [bacterium ADurb.Bin429]